MRNDGDILSLADVAKALDRSLVTVRIYLRCSGLPARLVGKSYVVLTDELAEWRSRPEIAEMLERGEKIREWGRAKRATREAVATS